LEEVNRLSQLKESLTELQITIINHAKRRRDLSGAEEHLHESMLSEMKEMNEERMALQTVLDEGRGVYEDLVFLNAVALLYCIE
jgi:hypothetical protein